uniref:Hypoxia-inducible factor 1-alpha-like n=1 Tax=Saccoglossus kowalevskii TaxID=10224 RepID=A0ABM0M7L3_SACKO|nr:PREDICTED: hypoxia-inducible factor 1-alpha-like [Saccoglossus kowalevskii]
MRSALDGFLFILTSDGTILYTSENIATHLGFNQVDLVHRCIYGIVHPDDHHELKVVLEHSLPDPRRPESQQSLYDVTSSDCPDYKKVQFLCRLKCFNGTSTGYVKMHCTGTMRSFPEVVKQSSRTSCQVLFAACQPFISLASDANIDVKNNVFGSKHEMDLKFKNVDDRVFDVAGYQPSQFEGKSFYEIIHLHDITAVFAWHKLCKYYISSEFQGSSVLLIPRDQ